MFKFLIRIIKQNKKFIKFGISGSTATVVDLSLLFYFRGILGFPLGLSVVLAFVVAFFVSFYLQKLWTFRDGANKKTKRQMVVFLAVALFNMTVLYFAVPFLESKGVYYLLAQLLSTLILSIGSFVMYNFVIFKKTHKNLKKKNLFLPDKFNGLRVLIAAWSLDEVINKLRDDFKVYGDRVKVILYKGDVVVEKGVYVIEYKKSVVVRVFEYFYHLYKIASWSDVVYLFANQRTAIIAFFACQLKRVPFVLEVDKAFVLGVFNADHQNHFFLKKIEKLILKKARIIVVRNNFLIDEVVKFGVDKDKVIALSEGENLRIGEYLL